MILLFPLVMMSVLRQCRVLTVYDMQTWQLQRSRKPPDHGSVFEVLPLIYLTIVRKCDGSCLSQEFSYLRPNSRHAFETVSWCLLTNAFSYAAHGSVNGRALVKGVEFILLNMIQNFSSTKVMYADWLPWYFQNIQVSMMSWIYFCL